MAKASLTLEMKAREAGYRDAIKRAEQLQTGFEQKLKKLTETSKKAGDEQRRFGQEAKRAYTEIRGPQEAYDRRMRALNHLLKEGKIKQEEYGMAAQRAGNRLQRAGQKGQQVYGRAAISQVKQLVGMLGLGGGVAGAVMGINRAYEVWLQNTREISAETNKAASEIVAFAALQAPGKKGERARETEALRARYNVPRGEAFTTVQAMQSILGSYPKGLQASETIFAAKRLDIPVELGRELEVLGASQGQKPGQSLRRAFVAGQKSGRDPEALARGAEAFAFFKDKDFAAAAGATIAENIKAEKIVPYLRQGAIALSPVTPGKEWFAQQGLGKEATAKQRLGKLHEFGITTPAQLEEVGFKEIRQQTALGAMLRNYGRLLEMAKEIPLEATPGLFARKWREMKSDMPMMGLSEQTGRLGREYERATAFGPAATEAQRVERRQRAQGIAMRWYGMESAMMRDLITEKGLTTKADLGWAAFWGLRGGPEGKHTISDVRRSAQLIEAAAIQGEPIPQTFGAWDPDVKQQLLTDIRDGILSQDKRPTVLAHPDEDR